MHPRLKTPLMITLACIAGYGAACLALAYRAPRMLYHPTARDDTVPMWVLDRDQTRVHVSHHSLDGEEAVLYLGGNAEDVSQALQRLSAVFSTASIHAMHYRGYGGSEGVPREHSLVNDALALYDYLAPRYRHITLVGRSLGSGIALQLAARRPSAQLVLITPYNSIAEIGQQKFPMFPVRWLLKDHYDSWRYAPQVHTPTTIVIAGRDQVIPNESSYRLAERFPHGVARIVALEDADHSTAPTLWHRAAASVPRATSVTDEAL